MNRRCSGRVWRDYSDFPCRSAGTLEHDGKWYCKKHHPPTVKEYERERNRRWEAKWADQDKVRAAAKREQALKDRALEWMRRENPRVVKEWEAEL